MLNRTRLPAIDDYCRAAGLTHRSGRGNVQRWDCPLAEHSHQGNLAINVDRGLWCCHGGCGGGDVLDLHMRRVWLSFPEAARDLGALPENGRPAGREGAGSTIARPPVSRPQPGRERAAAAEEARKQALAEAHWNRRHSLRGSPAAGYLTQTRGLTLPPADGEIGFVADFDARPVINYTGPAMIGRISLATDASMMLGLHVTPLILDGDSWVRGERRYLGRKTGGVVRLWPDEAVTHGLAVAEGIETALAAAHLQAPIWACMDAGNLAALPVLSGIDCLTVIADHDGSGTGQRAAADCAERWLKAGREATVLMSDVVGADLADEVAAC